MGGGQTIGVDIMRDRGQAGLDAMAGVPAGPGSRADALLRVISRTVILIRE
jgi:hypothetical protein